MLDYLLSFLILTGAALTFIGSLGLLRLKDFYTRLHGPTKATTLGVGCLLIASAIYFSTHEAGISLHEILITLFLFITAPVSAHMLAKAALHLGLPSLAKIPEDRLDKQSENKLTSDKKTISAKASPVDLEVELLEPKIKQQTINSGEGMNTTEVKTFLTNLQNSIVKGLEQVDGKPFQRDQWDRPGGGGGVSCVIEEGNVFERGGVNFSHVFGTGLPASATAARPELSGRSFEAMGVSLVLHPRNPYAPTVHMNVRFFEACKEGADPVWWFGGGMDLTPYYGYEEDAIHFHQTCKNALQPYGDDCYPRLKKWCDEYFYLKHRKEPRGIGGIFFDDLNEPDFKTCFNLTKDVGDNFLTSYVPILEKRINTPYGEQERDFQAFRRGRYVEFNLVWDRGTLFGLQTGGRTESILMSLPPIVKWRYDWKPQAGSAEDKLYTDFIIGKDWV